MAKIIIDSNDRGKVGDAISLTVENSITMYTFNNTGTHLKRRIGLQASPDGINWVTLNGTVKGNSCFTYRCDALQVRPIVSTAEGSESTVDVYLVAR